MLEKTDVAKAILQAQKFHHYCQVYLFILYPDSICQEIGYKEDEFSRNGGAGLSLCSANALPLQVDIDMSPACEVLSENGTSRKLEGALSDTSKVVPTNTAWL